MGFHFNKILPLAFEVKGRESSLWGSDLILESPGIFQIIASSGSGKSTLISFLAGLRNDFSGDILFDGSTLSGHRPGMWSKYRSRRVSFVFQDLHLFPALTVMENIKLVHSVSEGKSGFEYDKVVERSRLLGIPDKLNTPIGSLSVGQKQRVAILRAVSRGYDWLVMDEPFSHLDLENAEKAWNLIVSDATEKSAGVIIACLDPYSFIKADKILYL